MKKKLFPFKIYFVQNLFQTNYLIIAQLTNNLGSDKQLFLLQSFPFHRAGFAE